MANTDRLAVSLQELTLTPYDVLIVGGGIVGAGVARDAAMRGLRTALIEQYDYAFGTSSRSSRLLHGGLRYLAQGRVGLVYEASREKALLSRLAPHLCQPLDFLFPTRHGTQWRKWKLHIGVKVYDWMTSDRNFVSSRGLDREETLAALPGLDPTGLSGAVRYYDALTNDARLVLDTLRSAAHAKADLRSYTRLVASERRDNLWHAEVADTYAGGTATLRARTIINATGAWSDRLAPSETTLRPTKGIHLVVHQDRLPIGDEAVVLPEENRLLFAIPWGDRIILGTTDTDYDGPLETPGVTREDIDYVLGVVNTAFPQAGLAPADVLSTWSGLRPLVANEAGDPSDISREHEITQAQPCWWDITGGKLTTYRLMAEQAVDRLLAKTQIPARSCSTSDQPLLTEPAFSAVVSPPVSRDAIAHFAHREAACHLDDVMLRRTSWRHDAPDPAAAAETVAEWLADELDWSDEQRRQELARYQRIVEDAWYSPECCG